MWSKAFSGPVKEVEEEEATAVPQPLQTVELVVQVGSRQTCGDGRGAGCYKTALKVTRGAVLAKTKGSRKRRCLKTTYRPGPQGKALL